MNSGGVCVWTESIWWYSLWPKVKYCFTIPPASTLTFTYCGQHPNHQPGCPTFNKAETSSDVNYVRSGLNVILKSWPRNSNWVVSTSFAPGRSPRLARHQLVRLFPPFLEFPMDSEGCVQVSWAWRKHTPDMCLPPRAMNESARDFNWRSRWDWAALNWCPQLSYTRA